MLNSSNRRPGWKSHLPPTVLLLFVTGCLGGGPEAPVAKPKGAQPEAAAKPKANEGAAKPQEDATASGSVAPIAGATKETTNDKGSTASDAARPISKALPDEGPLELYAPRVVLSKAHEKTSKIKVNDTFPDLKVLNLNGVEDSTAEKLGGKLNVVLFWTSSDAYSREQFLRFQREVAGRYAALGVKAVAINVGDSAEVVKRLYDEGEGAFPSLRDGDGQALAKVSSGRPPRIFLLDSKHKVLWFDLEYSRGTARELHNAVHFFSRGEVATSERGKIGL